MTICKFIFGHSILFEIKKITKLPRPIKTEALPIGEFERYLINKYKVKKEEIDGYYSAHPELILLEKGLQEINKKYL